METSAVRGDGLIESMDWLVNNLGSHQTKKSTGQGHVHGHSHSHSHGHSHGHGPSVAARAPQFNSVAKCDTSTDTVLKDRSPSRDYCNRAYSAFKCFFIRPNVPPDIDD